MNIMAAIMGVVQIYSRLLLSRKSTTVHYFAGDVQPRHPDEERSDF